MNIDLPSLIDDLTIVAGVLSLIAFGLLSFQKWWKTRSGTATWVLHFVIVLLLAHFVAEEFQGQMYVRELILILALCGSLLYWIVVIIYKRWFYHDPAESIDEH